MDKSDLIFLWGMPGSGKTTLGKKLAKELNFKWIDSDHYIEEKTGKSIEDIFKNEGENYFRNLEKESLREFLNLNQVIISCGGGYPIFNENSKKMLNFGFCIYLKAEIGLIQQRILLEKNKRPLLSDDNKEKKLELLTEMFDKRKVIYETAHLHVKIPVKSTHTFVLQANTEFLTYKNNKKAGSLN